ncbi:unnamed protein product [marine sediment metagenome]|uniref:Uncharacterized protein n=1 Tax=marine sediment metagenome TaxID=412755 RepID=X1F8D4_9ZZZZ
MVEHMWTKPKNKSELESELKKVNRELTKWKLRKQSIELKLSEI